MRLLRCDDDGEFSLTADLAGDTIPPYAILSHTWGPDNEEVAFNDLRNGTAKDKLGYKKVQFCGKQARGDGLQYFWIDTCCINKANKAELSHAINSMFRWYRDATRCYVYLSDVSIAKRKASHALYEITWESAFRDSRWFTRGWTLQELLAPAFVDFFSLEGERLGDKTSLIRQICEITFLPESALQGAPLSQFSDKERFTWIQCRDTKVEEDKAYALLGIFDIEMHLRYGEGSVAAFRRLEEEINKLNRCLQDLRATDPRDDKKRIENTKGGLLEDSYRWILDNADFQQWRNNEQSRLLWVKGDPGKGKTMLLCGIIDELNKSTSTILSYFFCQATDSRINSAIAVLRGLLYMLVYQQPSLVSHIQKRYAHAGKVLFEDTNAWVALSEIFTDVLQNQSLKGTYLIIDALDECTDLPKLLDFIIQMSCVSSRVKWIVSSRNWPDIEKRLDRAGQKMKLSLELNAKSVSRAVKFYIKYRVDQLALDKSYKEEEKSALLARLTSNADNTFLWVALVCQDLSNIPRRKMLAKLETFLPGLDALYTRTLQHISSSDDANLCRHMLALLATVYRPLRLDELAHLDKELEDVSDDPDLVLRLCGLFLTIRAGVVYFVHQSAKDFLSTKAVDEIFPSGREQVHRIIFSRSLIVMSKTLTQDIYSLGAPGYPADDVKHLDLGPLKTVRYSCIYWVNHLYDWTLGSATPSTDLQENGSVHEFLKEKYLNWLEALSLCKSMSEGIVSTAKLEKLIRGRGDTNELYKLVQDARRFIMAHKWAIENSPLQAYASALVFSPARSLVRGQFKKEEPRWITIKPSIGDYWSACLQTLEGHSGSVNSVAFSHDSARLASASYDKTIKVWDISSGACLQTLKGHSNRVNLVVFSRDSAQLASASDDNTIKVWNATGTCIQTFSEHSDCVRSVAFSYDSARLASASYDNTVKVWDTTKGACVQTLDGHSSFVNSVTFSNDSARLASASDDNTVKVWDTTKGACVQTLDGHSDRVRSVAFSYDSARLTSASDDKTIKVWDVDISACLQTLSGHNDFVNSVVFSYDSARLASASDDNTIKIWDANGTCLQTLDGHSSSVNSVAFSYDSAWLASASYDNTIKVWDVNSSACLQNLDRHSRYVNSVAVSYDSAWLASASSDKTIKVWDVSSGACLQTLHGHSDCVRLVAFSYDSARLASVSDDKSIKVWDATRGACLQTLNGHSGYVNLVVFSYDSARLASASDDNTIKLWDVSSGACLQTLDRHSGYVNSVAFSNDSTWLASASYDNTVKVWDTTNGACLQTLDGHSGSVSSVAFSYNSTWLASASYDNTVKVWDATSGACLQTLDGHSGSVSSIAFSYRPTWLASASRDNTVKVWDVTSGACLQTLAIGRPLSRISFDITDSYLYTEIGMIKITVSPGSTTALASVLEPLAPQYQGFALSADGLWITYNSKNQLWLPLEYRPSCSVVSRDTICIGNSGGRVWICKVDVDKF